MEDTCQTIVIYSKLGKFKDACANLGAQLGIPSSVITSKVSSVFQGRFRGKTYQRFTSRVKKDLTFSGEEIITDLEIFLSFEMLLSPTF